MLNQRTSARILPKGHRSNLWFERLMAIVVLLNFLLVGFDWSYIPWRDFYAAQVPTVATWYGTRFKGIEPHRTTNAYLVTVEQIETAIGKDGLQSDAVEILLAALRSASAEMIDANPFFSANKTGILERIKNRMRRHLEVDSAKQAFRIFWSQDYLTRMGWQQELAFFNQKIRPLIVTNYYRNVDEYGNPIDLFWQIDLGFIGVFAIELFARLIYLMRRYRLTVLDAIVWRWYDLFLLLPVWRWLRVVPLIARLNQAKLVDLSTLDDRITRSLIARVAVELTEMVVLRIIDQVQDLIRQGEVMRLLRQRDRRYLNLNQVDEGAEISKRLAHLIAYQVLPKIQPDVEALLRHSVAKGLSLSPVYTSAKNIPGFNFISEQVTQQLVSDITQNTYQVLLTVLEDEEGIQLIQKLLDQFGEALRSELTQDQTVAELQTLMVDLLDEIKVNYVEQIAREEIDDLQVKTTQIYQLTQSQR